jgi:hypothetical protein
MILVLYFGALAVISFASPIFSGKIVVFDIINNRNILLHAVTRLRVEAVSFSDIILHAVEVASFKTAETMVRLGYKNKMVSFRVGPCMQHKSFS